MKTVVFTGPQRLEIRDVPLPALQPRQVLVRTRAVGLCTFEQRLYLGSRPENYPFRGGHEVSGEVVRVGPDAVTDAREGDVVALALLTRCGNCYYCRRGMDNLCVHNNENGLPGAVPGPSGLSEYVIAQDYQVYRSVPPAGEDTACWLSELALAEPVACVVRSVQAPPLRLGDVVIVQGAGIMGLLHVLLLKQRGVRVIMVEPDERRQSMARTCGADWVIDPRNTDLYEFTHNCTDQTGVNAAFYTAGGIPAIEQVARSLAKGGWLCLYGSTHPDGPLPLMSNDIHYRELFVTGFYSHTRASFAQAVTLISHQQLNMRPFVSECVPFPQLDFAFQRATSPDTYRVVVTFDVPIP